jgi:hypothetical protein
MAVKEAYDVLADPLRRGAYDRAARSLDQLRTAMVGDTAEVIHPAPPPPPPVVRTRGPRLSDLPLAVWAGLGIIALLAAGEAILHLNATPPSDNLVEVPATAPTVAPQVPPPAPHPVRLAGIPNVYVIPSSNPALVLRYDQARKVFVPMGQLPPFSALQAVRVLRDHGLVEIRLTDSTTGFIDATRVTPGNVAVARQAYCTYNSGAPPTNGEILSRHSTGTGQATIENRTGQPAVVRLRDRDGLAVASVYLAPGGDAVVDGLADGAYRPDFAIGELWSRACNGFAAGMRAQRFDVLVELPAAGALTIPPDFPGQPPPVDISDQDFEHD